MFVCWRQSVVWGPAGTLPNRLAVPGREGATRDKPTEKHTRTHARTHLPPTSVAPLKPHDIRVPCLLQLPQCCITPGPTIVTHLQQQRQSDKVCCDRPVSQHTHSQPERCTVYALDRRWSNVQSHRLSFQALLAACCCHWQLCVTHWLATHHEQLRLWRLCCNLHRQAAVVQQTRIRTHNISTDTCHHCWASESLA